MTRSALAAMIRSARLGVIAFALAGAALLLGVASAPAQPPLASIAAGKTRPHSRHIPPRKRRRTSKPLHITHGSLTLTFTSPAILNLRPTPFAPATQPAPTQIVMPLAPYGTLNSGPFSVALAGGFRLSGNGAFINIGGPENAFASPYLNLVRPATGALLAAVNGGSGSDATVYVLQLPSSTKPKIKGHSLTIGPTPASLTAFANSLDSSFGLTLKQGDVIGALSVKAALAG
jgi:hypothetical protein